MPLVNHAKKEINVKLVFFGPRCSGKSTTLQFIYKKLRPDCRSQLKTLQTQGGRMLFYDFMPADLPSIEGYRARFHLYTLPDEPLDSPTWKMVLKGVDGVMFVADAAAASREDNRHGIAQLRAYLSGAGSDCAAAPVVVQCNKQDLPDALNVQEITADLEAEGGAVVATTATSGEGVLQSLAALVKMVMKELRDKGPGVPPPENEEPEPAERDGSGLSPEPAGLTDVPEELPVDEAEDFAETLPAGDQPVVRITGAVTTAANVVSIPVRIRSGERDLAMTVAVTITLEP